MEQIESPSEELHYLLKECTESGEVGAFTGKDGEKNRTLALGNGITFYKKMNTELYSTSYASCIGIAIHRHVTKGNPKNIGLLAHFWNYKFDSINNFRKALHLLISEIWGTVNKDTDSFTIWTGTSPQAITYNRLKAFCGIWDKGKKLKFPEYSLDSSIEIDFEFKSISINKANISGEVHLDIASGMITQDSKKSVISNDTKPISYLSILTGILDPQKNSAECVEVKSFPTKNHH